MPPAKPLPILVPTTSTYWPATKCAAVISAPTGTNASSDTRNSARCALGSTFAAAHWLCYVLDLGATNAELQRDVAVAILGAVGDNLAIIDTQHRYRHMAAIVGEDAAHAELFRDEAGTHRHHPLELDLDIDAGGEVELHQRVYGLRCRIDDIDHPLMGADFELLARLLIDVRRAQHGELLDPGRQRDRPSHPSAGAAGGLHDLAGRLVEHAMIVSPQADAYVLAVHQSFPASPLDPRVNPGDDCPHMRTVI